MDAAFTPKRIRAGLIDFMSSQPFTHALTLNTDRQLSISQLKGIFGTFCAKIDRATHGIKRVTNIPRNERLNAFVVPEHLSTNAHLHGMADLARLRAVCRDEAELDPTLYRLWRQSTRGAGSVHVTSLYSMDFGDYSLKDAWSTDVTYFLAADFHPH